MNPRRVGILVFPEVEVLDFCGPFEVFSVTRLDEGRRRQDASPYEVVIIAENPGVVVATEEAKVSPITASKTARRWTCWWFPAGGEPVES